MVGGAAEEFRLLEDRHMVPLLQESDGACDPRGAAADDPLAPRPPHFPARAKRVIWLFINGGPSQVDTFDHKPELARRSGEPIAGFESQPGVQGLIHFGMWVDSVEDSDKAITAAGGVVEVLRPEMVIVSFGAHVDCSSSHQLVAVKCAQRIRERTARAYFANMLIVVDSGPVRAVPMVC